MEVRDDEAPALLPAEYQELEEVSPVWTQSPTSASAERCQNQAQNLWGKHPARQ